MARSQSYEEWLESLPETPESKHDTARQVHATRSRKARIADESFKAQRLIKPYRLRKEPELVREYYRNPNRMDILGIDDVADEYKQARVERVRDAFLEAGVVSGINLMSVEQMREELDHPVSGQFDPEDQGVVLQKERLEKQPARASSTLAHELGHALDSQLERIPLLGDDHHKFGAAAEIAAEEAGKKKKPPMMPGSDQPFHEQIHEVSALRRGQIHEGDQYRTRATEKFADWFATAVEEPRHTKVKYGTPWRALEERADQLAIERLEFQSDQPRRKVREKVKEAIDEATTGVDLDWSHRDPRWDEADELRKAALEEVDERFEREYGETMTGRVERRAERLESFDATRPQDFAGTAASNEQEDYDDLFEGVDLDRLVPREKIEEYGEMMGYEIGDIEVE